MVAASSGAEVTFPPSRALHLSGFNAALEFSHQTGQTIVVGWKEGRSWLAASSILAGKDIAVGWNIVLGAGWKEDRSWLVLLT